MSLSGGQLSGGNLTTERAENDFYTTNSKAVTKLLECFECDNIALSRIKYLEPCVGIGNITGQEFDFIINPPYSLASDFVNKSMEILSKSGMCCMFLKLQFWECAKRKEFFEKYPPRYIYVFENRMDAWKNGLKKNPETDKKWANTICFAWFVWIEGSTTEPTIIWID